jgi:hypothetical protein
VIAVGLVFEQHVLRNSGERENWAAWRDRSRGQPLRDTFFVQPMTAVVASPNLSAHKPAGNCASGDDDRP